MPAKKEGLRLGVSKSFLKNIEPEIETLWNKAITAFQNAGIVIVEIDASEIMRLNALVGFPVALYEANSDMRSYLKKYDVGISIEELAAEISSPDVAGTYKGLVLPTGLC
jgi:mandelamide amidase